MTRVVVDTNVLVSALLSERGAPSAVLALIVEGQLIWCPSEAMVAEYASVLSRSKFQHIQRSKIAAALALARAGEMTITTTSVTSSVDESDNRFLECAEAAQADYLVTGNTRHFPKKWKQTSIVTPRQQP
jgi:uncharacterized protein